MLRTKGCILVTLFGASALAPAQFLPPNDAFDSYAAGTELRGQGAWFASGDTGFRISLAEPASSPNAIRPNFRETGWTSGERRVTAAANWKAGDLGGHLLWVQMSLFRGTLNSPHVAGTLVGLEARTPDSALIARIVVEVATGKISLSNGAGQTVTSSGVFPTSAYQAAWMQLDPRSRQVSTNMWQGGASWFNPTLSLDPTHTTVGSISIFAHKAPGENGDNTFLDNFQASTAVPEPATVSVFALGAFTLLRRRKR